MAQPDYVHPSDQIRNIQGLISSMRLTIRGLVQLGGPPTETEEWGMYLILDNIDDRLNLIDSQIQNPRASSNNKTP